MRAIFSAVLAAALLVGCASTQPPQPISGAAKSRGITVVGSLASVGAADELTAASWTRLALLRHNAALRLEDGRISLAKAKGIQAAADRARILLDAALAADAAGNKLLALQHLSSANKLIEGAEAQLSAVPWSQP